MNGRDERPSLTTPGTVITEIVRLYREGLSTRRIGDAIGMDRQAVTRVLRMAHVPIAPRGAGRGRPTARLLERPEVDRMIRELYLGGRLTRKEIARKLQLRESEVRSRMAAAGIPTRTRGPSNREDRHEFDPDDLAELYLGLDLSADEVGEQLGTSRHTVLRAAHEWGLPVRVGGDGPPARGPAEIELIRALYHDPLVADAVSRHHLPIRPPESPIQQRFPEPFPLTRDLLADLYENCGLSVLQIELLTGQPAATVRNRLRGWGIAMRPPGGRSPFRVRWRHDQTALRRRAHQRLRADSAGGQAELDGTGVSEVASSDSTIHPAT